MSQKRGTANWVFDNLYSLAIKSKKFASFTIFTEQLCTQLYFLDFLGYRCVCSFCFFKKGKMKTGVAKFGQRSSSYR